jgi:anti-sigma B factor antagonist
VRFEGAEPEPFRCEVVPDRAAVRVRPVGELDLATVPLVEAELTELWTVGFTRIVLDLREVCFLDSAGVRLLLTWHAHSSADGLVFAVIAGPREVQRVLEVSGIADRLTYCSPNGRGSPREPAREQVTTDGMAKS